MSRSEELRLKDILNAIELVREHVGSGQFDRKTSDAVLYNLVVIGEGRRANRKRHSCACTGNPVVEDRRLRNLIAHEYFLIDLELIQSIVSEQLDSLESAALRLLSEPDGS